VSPHGIVLITLVTYNEKIVIIDTAMKEDIGTILTVVGSFIYLLYLYK